MPDGTQISERIRAAAQFVRRSNLELCLRLDGSYLTQACSGAEMLCTLYLGGLALNSLGEALGAVKVDDLLGTDTTAHDSDLLCGSRYNGPITPETDRLFISACHYAGAVYATLVAAGRLESSALEHVGEDGWNLDIVAAEHSPGYETVSGSLGHTISIAAGTAQAYKLKGWTGRIVCLISDGELNEGQDWECIQLASQAGLSNFVVLVDVNNQQAEGWTHEHLSLEPLDMRFEAFGWQVVRVDGHDPEALLAALATEHTDKPLAILCDTNPAQGIPELEQFVPAHFVTVCGSNRELLQTALENMQNVEGV